MHQFLWNRSINYIYCDIRGNNGKVFRENSQLIIYQSNMQIVLDSYQSTIFYYTINCKHRLLSQKIHFTFEEITHHTILVHVRLHLLVCIHRFSSN